jgi:hypothetical protein
MGISRSSCSGPAPQTGDIILRRADDLSHRYTIATTGEPPQIACKTFEEAIRRADAFAQSCRVDVWHTDDGRIFERIARSRLADTM